MALSGTITPLSVYQTDATFTNNGPGNFPGGINRVIWNNNAYGFETWNFTAPAIDPGYGIKSAVFRGDYTVMPFANAQFIAIAGNAVVADNGPINGDDGTIKQGNWSLSVTFENLLTNELLTQLRLKIYGTSQVFPQYGYNQLAGTSNCYIDWVAAPVGKKMRMVI